MRMVPCTSSSKTRSDEEDNGNNYDNRSSSNLVSSASYPIPQHLSRLLVKAAVIDPTRPRNKTIVSSKKSSKKKDEADIELESVDQALELLMCNAFHAMDSMYFASSPAMRKAPWFQHRLVLRILLDASKSILTLSDYGCGMTRADLINALGIGASSQHNNTENATALGIGSFYAAIATLATSFQVGTKSKFDDYYEFQIETPNYENFTITRPYPTSITSHDNSNYADFGNIHDAESGTKITLQLKESVVTYLTASTTSLQTMLQHIVDNNSCYSFLLLQDDNKDDISVQTAVKDLIQASSVEDKERTNWLETNDHNDDNNEVDEVDSDFNRNKLQKSHNNNSSHNTIKERSKYIPLRLSMGERKMLRLVEAAMTCCDYTTLVDDVSSTGSNSAKKSQKMVAKRTHTILRHITSVLQGLVLSCDSNANLDEEDDEEDYSAFFRRLFEIARRHKVMNPEKMRTEYGKLIYMLQDAVSPTVQPNLPYCKNSSQSLVAPMETVYKFLSERNGLAMLEDPLMETATEEILAGKKTRAQINAEIKRKERAVAMLKQNYKSSQLSADDVHLCLYSICDNESFLNSNRVPIDKVIDYLKNIFAPSKIEDGYSLSIVSGQDGARLSHSHERQYYFALQSLTLWRDIIDDMFRLWAMAEGDLLSESVTYSLQDTGQGMQRVQQSPRTYKSMQKILNRVQRKVNKWVGSSVIHLGDHNVPNSLSFIDKYTQVPRILGPIVSCLENLERICEEDKGIEAFVSSGFGGLERLKKDILYDFFKSAFDGSGADNFYDAGSCIDGRLTSAWNWCSQLPNKPFYCIFKLTGFTGFDGEFK